MWDRLLRALKGLESPSADLAILSAQEAEDVLRSAGCGWDDVIQGPLDAAERARLAFLMKQGCTGATAEAGAALKAANQMIARKGVDWPKVIEIPDRRQSLAQAKAREETVRIETTCFLTAGRFYTVARKFDPFTIALFAVAPIENRGGFLGRPPPSPIPVAHNFQGKIRLSEEWPGCPFCADSGFLQHPCRTGALFFCHGGIRREGNVSHGTCPLCKEALTIKKATVFEVVSEPHAMPGSAPRSPAGPALGAARSPAALPGRKR